ncbi:MAG: hypothetical protein K2L82_17975 [Lachnospiraceae bacterium]|nr:hypothetical protein [Lachnospiraceae bacterium]
MKDSKLTMGIGVRMKTEWEMVLECKECLEQKKEYKKIECEIPFLSRCIDMVLISQSDKVITIEFKLTKWRDAIAQAYDHLRGADYAYVCMPKRNPSGKLIDALKQNGIGLLLYDEQASVDQRIDVYLEAEKSNRRIDVLSGDIIRNVELCGSIQAL